MKHRLVTAHRARTISAKAAVGVLATGAMMLSSFTAVAVLHSSGASASDSVASIDLSNPTATINDPAARLVPVDTTCTNGKIDLNTASATSLSAALGIPSGPTIARLIALRPWLKGSDLSSVAGIGPSKAASIAALTCAAQPDPATPQPRACSSTGEVDLNTASAAVIQSQLGLPANTVSALIAARPLPQNLSQIVPPRVPGLPQPKIDSLTQQGLLCVTPSPYIAGNSLYRWATPKGGAVVRNGSIALIVPPGRITNSVGAYAAATIEPPTDRILPTGDFHIFGPWMPQVITEVPPPPGTSDTAGLIVSHERGDGDTAVSYGGGIAVVQDVNGPEVVSAANTLSTFTTYILGTCADPNHDPRFLCPNSGQPSDELLQNITNHAVLQWTQDATAPATDCLVKNIRAKTTGFSDGNLGCEADIQNDHGVWTFTNNSKHLLVTGIVYHADPSGGTFDESTTCSDFGDAIFTQVIADQICDSHRLPPTATLTVTKGVGSGDTSLAADGDAHYSSLWWSEEQLGTLLDLAVQYSPLSVTLKAQADLGKCGFIVAAIATDGVDKVREALNCMRDAAAQFLTASRDAAQADVDATTDPAAKAVKISILSRVASLLEAAKKIGYVLIGVDALVSGSELGTRGFTITMRTLSPPPPPISGGLTSFMGLSGDGTFVARSVDREAFLVQTDGSGHATSAIAIASNTTFNCLVLSRFVMDHIDVSGTETDKLLILPGGTVPVNTTQGINCDASTGPNWSYTGIAQGGNVPGNVILKEPDWIGRASFYVDQSGTIQNINDGGTYDCLVPATRVIYNVPIDQINNWPSPQPLPLAKCP